MHGGRSECATAAFVGGRAQKYERDYKHWKVANVKLSTHAQQTSSRAPISSRASSAFGPRDVLRPAGADLFYHNV